MSAKNISITFYETGCISSTEEFVATYDGTLTGYYQKSFTNFTYAIKWIQEHHIEEVNKDIKLIAKSTESCKVPCEGDT